MRFRLISCLSFFPAYLLLFMLFLDGSASTADAQHRVLLQGKNRLAIVDTDGNIEWEMPWGFRGDALMRPSAGNEIVATIF